jgi:hypothetical protein
MVHIQVSEISARPVSARIARKFRWVMKVASFANFFSIIALGSAFMHPLLGLGQITTVPVTIQVFDPSGAPIPKVRIHLFPLPMDLSSEMTADEKGQLTIPLKPGGYCAALSSQGFVTFRGHIDIRGPVTVPVTLKIGGCTECIVVLPADGTILTVVGPPYGQLFFGMADLRKKMHVEVSAHNSSDGSDGRYSGVPLADLLTSHLHVRSAGAGTSATASATFIIASGASGKKSVIAAAELSSALHPANVIIADSYNGKPLAPSEGPLRLIVGADRGTARSIDRLVSIEIKSAE